MIIARTKRFFLIIVAVLAAGLFSLPSFSAEVSEKTGSQKSDAQTDKERLIESRKEQQQKRKELRDSVKSGASKEELEQRKKGLKKDRKQSSRTKRRSANRSSAQRIKVTRGKARNLLRTPNN
jgi:Skp family chaperone for outer membrane proteins